VCVHVFQLYACAVLGNEHAGEQKSSAAGLRLHLGFHTLELLSLTLQSS
jgi:hypothetical protein